MTKRPLINEVEYKVTGKDTYIIRCPGCDGGIGIGLRPTYREGYRLDDKMHVLELVVCHNHDGEEYCDWSGVVRLAKRVTVI